VTTQARLRRFAEQGGEIRVAIVGAGFIGRGLAWVLARNPGMRPALIVNRSIDRGRRAFAETGHELDSVVVSDDPDILSASIEDGRPAVTSSPEALGALSAIDLVIEATGALEHGARVIIDALRAGRDVVSMNAELDATVGYLLHDEAERSGAVYTIGDGDQPGVLLRQLDFVAGMGIEIVAAVNCKRNLDLYQTPDDSRPYAARDGTSVHMTTAFGDGTKMQIENAVVANVSGLVPDVRGMHGVQTTVAQAAADITSVLSRRGVVEYTLGGDFGGGVGVVGRSDDPLVAPYMRYGKLEGESEWFFFRPFHLLHFEVPMTIADVVLDRQPLGAPPGPPVAEVVAVAKRDLRAGEALDGIGGYTCYGVIDTVDGAAGLLPIGLTEHATLRRAVPRDEPVPLDAVELDDEAPLVGLRRRQDELVGSALEAVD
jgi:predicted homoserine dehydrogenase-like protein